MENTLNIKTVSVQIQILTVDGKRLTKAVFNQIIERPCIDKNCNFIGKEVLGYVKSDIDYLVWVSIDNKLRKTPFTTKNNFSGALNFSMRDFDYSEKQLFEKKLSQFIRGMKENQLFIAI